MMDFFESHGAWGLFLLAFAESSFFPLPPDVLLIALGLKWPGQALQLAGITTLGSALGGLAGYAIGFFGGRPLLLRFAVPEKVAKVEAVFDRYGVWGVAMAGFTPIPYKVFTIASGACRLKIIPFFIASVLSRGARFFLEAILLHRFGEQVRQKMDLISLVLVGLCVVAAVAWWLWRRRRNRLAAAVEPAAISTAAEVQQPTTNIPSQGGSSDA